MDVSQRMGEGVDVSQRWGEGEDNDRKTPSRGLGLSTS